MADRRRTDYSRDADRMRLRIEKGCPHCGAPLASRRLLVMSRWTPYVCPSCGHRFLSARWWSILETLLGLAILIPLAKSQASWWILGAAFAGYVLVISILDCIFAPLTPAESKDNHLL